MILHSGHISGPAGKFFFSGQYIHDNALLLLLHGLIADNAKNVK
jgi:hypothetical protein